MSEPSELSGNHGVSICLVEDDRDLREEVVQTLLEYDFDVRSFVGSRELYLGLLQQPCDVAILDVGLPGEDGFTIMENLRATSSMGIIMFTARGQVTDRVRALMGGADAYLVKPVDMVELVATILSLSRRLRSAESAPPKRDGGWRLSDDGWILHSPAGVNISLSGAERSFLQVLAQHLGIAVSREELVKALGHHEDEVLSNRLDMLVSRLRRKVAQATDEKLPLHSVRGIGFSLHASVVGNES